MYCCTRLSHSAVTAACLAAAAAASASFASPAAVIDCGAVSSEPHACLDLGGGGTGDALLNFEAEPTGEPVTSTGAEGDIGRVSAAVASMPGAVSWPSSSSGTDFSECTAIGTVSEVASSEKRRGSGENGSELRDAAGENMGDRAVPGGDWGRAPPSCSADVAAMRKLAFMWEIPLFGPGKREEEQ